MLTGNNYTAPLGKAVCFLQKFLESANKNFLPSVRIKPSFFVPAAFSFFIGMEKYFLTVFVLLFLHELCHIFTAGMWGLRAKAVTVLPIGLYAEIAGLEELHIIKRLAVAAAGPVFNLTLCFFCGGAAREINLALALFNLLPVYPLDGGKIFCCILGFFTGVLRGNAVSVKIGLLSSVIMTAAGVLQLILYPPNISLFCLGIYLYRFNKACTASMTYRFFKSLRRKKDAEILPVRCVSASEDTDIKTVVYRLDRDHYTLVYLRDNAPKCITEEKIIDYITKNGLRGQLKNIFEDKANIQEC